ncbi:MAG: hypothetical protein R6V03_03850 [Kiritimatiellia bacterium]
MKNGRQRGEICPGCERFIGPADKCPYCGADSAKPGFLRLLRRLSLAAAAAGVLFLYLMAVNRELPLIKVSDITPTMNFAYVRVRGKVIRKPYVGRDEPGSSPSYVSFSLNDGTGVLRAVAYRQAASKLHEAGLIPAEGERVEVSGSLSVSAEAGRTKLYLRSPGSLISLSRPVSTEK